MTSIHQRSASLLGVLALTLPAVAGCSVAPATEGVAVSDGVGVAPQAAGGGSSQACDGGEGNDKRKTAAPLAYDTMVDFPDWVWDPVAQEPYEVTHFEASIHWTDAVLCEKDKDWYRIETSDLAEQYGAGTLEIKIRARAAGASECPADSYPSDWESWWDPSWPAPYDPPAGPESTLIAEVYSAATGDLLGAQTSPIGRITLDVDGPELREDLLVRFYGAKEAEYDYMFRITVQSHAYDSDECEF